MNIPGVDDQVRIASIKPAVGQAKSLVADQKVNSDDRFQSILEEKSGLKFSNHAIGRLANRGVNLDETTVGRLSKAVEMADKKGADQSLVLLDQLAFLVSIRNKTVITAVETANMKEGVFTKIDSAIIG